MMIPVVQLQRQIAYDYILGIVVNKLSYQQELSLIVLFKVDKGSNISFKSTDQFFDLAVGLQWKSNTKQSFDAKKITKLWPELNGKKQALLIKIKSGRPWSSTNIFMITLASPIILMIVFTNL